MLVSINIFPEPRPVNVLPETLSTTISTSALLLMSRLKVISNPLEIVISLVSSSSISNTGLSSSAFEIKSINEMSARLLFSSHGIIIEVPFAVAPSTSIIKFLVGP